MLGRAISLLFVPVLAGGCAADPHEASPAAAEGAHVTCGGPSFDLAVLDRPGGAEQADDPAAAALRDHLAADTVETDWLPDEGWIDATRTEHLVQYVAETPFLLELPGPLGDRALSRRIRGPAARDARECPELRCP